MMFYFANFQSVMGYGIIFWGNSKESKRVVQLQKKNNQNYDWFRI
jgi:uncharacterized Tic20 family protein